MNKRTLMQKTDAVRKQMEATFDKASPTMNNDEIISNRILCKPWKAGSHTANEIYGANGQIWQCIQNYDNAIYPDIVPGKSAWATFHKPYHGTTRETAMPWVAPTGAHDMYAIGEYMVWTDCVVYRCLTATAYSPGDYAAAWEAV